MSKERINEWSEQMRKIVDDAYGEDWTDYDDHMRAGGTDATFAWMWENRYNDAAKELNMLIEWLIENTDHFPTLMPLLMEWRKQLIAGDGE